MGYFLKSVRRIKHKCYNQKVALENQCFILSLVLETIPTNYAEHLLTASCIVYIMEQIKESLPGFLLSYNLGSPAHILASICEHVLVIQREERPRRRRLAIGSCLSPFYTTGRGDRTQMRRQKNNSRPLFIYFLAVYVKERKC